ncbi:PotD/PotF family extracellular solute-binding protein [Acidiphilium sp. JA12-A1]|uniref:ABC transporter substrate-binding protein n=1 Tax=Acidiphilium sp. JA12-A1 TaxID=1464546 RepID=UPI0004613ADA|nr:extracellular solute-binding protein [Acidiphilium sp. JA12-A1]KDM65372.1 Tat pathway signal sequence domain protein [Acidiphilium sp. JA12-A1]
MTMKLDRRLFLATGGTAAGLALAGGMPRARAATREVVVGTWGGDYERLMKKFVAPLAAKQGVRFVADVGNAPARKTKLIAQSHLPTNSMDIACLSNDDMAEVAALHTLADINETQVPNIANVFPNLRKPYAIPHIYSALVLVYNPAIVPKPNSYADLWKPDYAGKIGFSDILYIYNIIAAAEAHGGKPGNFDAAKKPLLALRDKVKIYPSNEAVANALHSTEIGVTVMWKARAFQWAKNGVPVKFSVPDEGATPVVFEAAMTRNANNPKGAEAFLNAMLDPQAQLGFAEAMGYLPTVSNAKLPKKLDEELGFTEAQRKNFFIPDEAYMIKTTSQWLDWWRQDFRG